MPNWEKTRIVHITPTRVYLICPDTINKTKKGKNMSKSENKKCGCKNCSQMHDKKDKKDCKQK